MLNRFRETAITSENEQTLNELRFECSDALNINHSKVPTVDGHLTTNSYIPFIRGHGTSI